MKITNTWRLGGAVIWGLCLISFIRNDLPDVMKWLALIIIVCDLELAAHPIEWIATFIKAQLDYRREAAQRRRQYELFKAGVKSGLYATDEQIADENRRVIQ